MLKALRIKARLRRFARRHPRVNFAIRSTMMFMAAFGGAFGFLSGSLSARSGYDPNAFALGASFLFAVACVALAMLSMRMRWLRHKMRKIALHNESLIDRNWELKEAEERAQNLFESQSDLVLRRDAQGRITYANEACRIFVQKERNELLGTAFAFEVLEQGDAAVEADGTRVHDQRIAGPLGPRWIAWRESLVRPEAGRPAETLCIGRDVTDRAETERALGDARDYANAANRAKSKFLATASHEIRTPLNGIIGMSGLLLDTPLTPEQITYARAVKTSGEALLSLIEELLDFSKIEAGKIDLEQRPFQIGVLIEEITELLAPRAHARGLEIASYVDERLPFEVIGDAARLRQVLLNLAGNAIKFTQTGGVALIVEPGIWPNEVSFLVRDTGIGIAPDAQSRIFREFEQADENIARNYGGSGLGLSISERIVRRMGGRIALESAPGEGATFEVTVPLKASETLPMPAFVAPDMDGKSILLVAPQTIEAALIARRLERWGAQTCSVSDICVARALLPERSWHAIIVDHALGATEVQDFGAAAQSHAARRIAMLTPAERHDVSPATMAPFSGYLIKPLRTASLAARLSHDVVPLVPESDADMTEPRSTAADKGLSILVAEDNEINALLMRSLLTRLGHRPVISVNGQQAFESWLAAETAGTPYDLILMDVQMPELDGVAATRLIRTREAERSSARAKILALTANTLVEDRYACFEAGMDGFLIKPLDRDKLAEALMNMTPSPHPVA